MKIPNRYHEKPMDLPGCIGIGCLQQKNTTGGITCTGQKQSRDHPLENRS